jgi:hypothetical protein
MSRKRHRRRSWIVHRKFEPNRLSPAALEQAYAKIVPQRIRILDVPAGEMEEPRQVRQLPKVGSVK